MTDPLLSLIPPVGFFELMLAVPILVVAIALAIRGWPSARWWFAAGGSVAVAMVLTPADLFSTLLFAAILLAMFGIGVRSGSRSTSPAA